jgi:hypothetical protein
MQQQQLLRGLFGLAYWEKQQRQHHRWFQQQRLPVQVAAAASAAAASPSPAPFAGGWHCQALVDALLLAF